MMNEQRKAIDLEALREIFGSKDITLAQALVLKVEVQADGSKARVLCNVMPEEYEVVAEVSFDSTGPESGFFPGMPVPNDLVLLGFTNPDEVFVLRRLTSKEDAIPPEAILGNLVAKALAGKKAYLQSDTGIFLGVGGGADPDEPLVLANVLMSALSDLIAQFDLALDKVLTGPIGVGNLGSPVATDPALAAALTQIRVDLAVVESDYITTPATNIASQIAFTERG